MRTRIFFVPLLVLALKLTGMAQSPSQSSVISFKFVVDGKTITCQSLKIELLGDFGRIEPKQIVGGFVVPDDFIRPVSAQQSSAVLDVRVACDQYSLDFPNTLVTRVRPGEWTAGIAYPYSWFEEFTRTNVIDHGTWISYLESACNECDPGVIAAISHPDPPPDLVSELRTEQAQASGARARDIAYSLAVFNVEYRSNRDYLMGLFRECLSRKNDLPEDDVCDSRLLDYVTNLYWRGDGTLLRPLLQAAQNRTDVIGDIGTFYADMLEGRTAGMVEGLRELSAEKQDAVCWLAGDNDLATDPPRLAKTSESLHKIGDPLARRCLQQISNAIAGVPLP